MKVSFLGPRRERAVAVVSALAVAVGLGSVPARAAVPAPRPQAAVPGAMSAPRLPEGSLPSERRGARFAAAGSSAAVPRPPGRPANACGATWRLVDGVDSTWNDSLGGVSAASPTDIWAVGTTQDSASGIDQNLVEHWDGSAWSIVAIPNPGPAGNDMADVAALDATHAFAVGISLAGSVPAASAFSWDGVSWSRIDPPALPSASYFNDVVAFSSADVWAVGAQLATDSSGVYRTLVEHWDGSAWTPMSSPNLGSGSNSFAGISGVSGSDIWAVGYSRPTPDGANQSLVEHYNGAAWAVVASANLPGVGNTLLHVSTAGGEALAVGYALGAQRSPIAERFDGSIWVLTSTPGTVGAGDNVLEGLVGLGAGDAWAVGYSASAGVPHRPLAEHWNGSNWSVSDAATRGPEGALYSVTTGAAGDIWATGWYANPALSKPLVENYAALGPPGNVAATPGDTSAAVNWTPPCDGGATVTSYVVSAYDGCTLVGSQGVVAPSSGHTYSGLGNGTAYSFTVTAVNAFGRGPESARSSPVTPAGATAPSWVTACSPQQYQLTSSDGNSWFEPDAANLRLSLAPAVDADALLSANLDLWTAAAGYNQDVGIFASDDGAPETLVAWKESGGFAGTFSPNAAFVHAVFRMTGAHQYVFKLKWKTNRNAPGVTIFAGAGPIGAAFSPTRVSAQVVPASSHGLVSAVSTQQYPLSNSDGVHWLAMDGANLQVSFTPGADGYAVLFGNADLWTANAGYNQDLGVIVSDNGVVAESPAAWRESGGFAGTFSPNAAAVETVIPVSAGHLYSASLVWKANRADSGTIYAGAGPIGEAFSPTRLSVLLVPALAQAASTQQYQYVNSDGSFWQGTDSSALEVAVSPLSDTTYALSANADLWTSVAGYNQDIGIMVSGGAYGPGTMVAWKESGGFAGTLSPNAALVAVPLQLQSGNTYIISVVWKANRAAQAANAVWSGAGPINAHYSPTSLVVRPLSSP